MQQHQKMMGHILAGGGGIVALAVLAVFLMMYGGSSERTVTNAKQVQFHEIAHGEKSGVTFRVNYLINDDIEFDKLWKLLNSKEPKPKVDFSSGLLAAVFAGSQPTTGYSIQVSKVEDADTRNVIVEIVKPDGGCTPKAATTTPFQIIQLPRTTLSFGHEDAVISQSCR